MSQRGNPDTTPGWPGERERPLEDSGSPGPGRDDRRGADENEFEKLAETF